MTRVCYRCRQPGGVGPRELRPYGSNGEDICAMCVFGKDGKTPNKRRLAVAEKKLREQLVGDTILDHREQVGPRPIKPKGRA